MPALRCKATGVVVNVSDETAKALAATHEPVKASKAAPRKASAKTDK